MSEAVPGSDPCKSTSKRLLIVEGKNDCHVVLQLAAQNGLEDSFGLWRGDSDGGAVAKFSAIINTRQTDRPTALGIVLDCDAGEDGQEAGAARRWAQIMERLADLPYPLHEAPLRGGTILDGIDPYPRIGVWLMPDNENEGMLEDFLLSLAPTAAVAFARQCAQSARNQGWGDYKLVHESKAVAHTYLAWQDEPGKPLGLAVKSHKFDLSRPLAGSFIQWLSDLFRTEEQAAQA